MIAKPAQGAPRSRGVTTFQSEGRATGDKTIPPRSSAIGCWTVVRLAAIAIFTWTAFWVVNVTFFNGSVGNDVLEFGNYASSSFTRSHDDMEIRRVVPGALRSRESTYTEQWHATTALYKVRSSYADNAQSGISTVIPAFREQVSSNSTAPTSRGVSAYKAGGSDTNRNSSNHSRRGELLMSLRIPASSIRAAQSQNTRSPYFSYFELALSSGIIDELMPDPFNEHGTELPEAVSQKNMTEAPCKFLQNTDYIGIDTGMMTGLTASNCCNVCKRRNEMRPGSCEIAVVSSTEDDPPHACWLKRSIHRKVAKQGVIACIPPNFKGEEMMASTRVEH